MYSSTVLWASFPQKHGGAEVINSMMSICIYHNVCISTVKLMDAIMCVGTCWDKSWAKGGDCCQKMSTISQDVVGLCLLCFINYIPSTTLVRWLHFIWSEDIIIIVLYCCISKLSTSVYVYTGPNRTCTARWTTFRLLWWNCLHVSSTFFLYFTLFGAHPVLWWCWALRPLRIKGKNTQSR